MSERIIVFGGTFDPVHAGHLAIAEQVLQRTGMDGVWFVPANIPALRVPAVAPADQRLAMLRAALVGRDRISVLESELHRGGTSYTADTMDELHTAYPSVEFWILVGTDAARSIAAWHRARDLLARERFLIVNRSGMTSLDDGESAQLGFDPQRAVRLEVASPPVSAGEVRRRAATGEDVTGLVPEAVAALIHARELYGSHPRVHNALG